MTQAKLLQDQNSVVAQNQSIALYERAVKLAPDYAEAWGWLGLVCGVCSHYRERPEALALRSKAMSAGNQALQLDDGNVYGEMALAVAQPFIGHWPEWDQRMTRALAKEPHNNDLLTYRAVMLQFEGRAAESVPLYQRISEKPFRPAVYVNYIKALWTAGRPVELEDALDDAASLYPTVGSLWFTRFAILAYGGRTDAAVSLAQTSEGRPPDLGDDAISSLVKLARAIGSKAPAEVDEVMADQMKAAHLNAGNAEQSIRNSVALGRIDDAFTLTGAYYFARGFTIPDFPTKGSAFSPGERQTRLLFEPVTAPMRADPRFEGLVRDLGFDRYWRSSGVRPDYRRA
jgi:tetratricopeptide (TPR) repeat protein